MGWETTTVRRKKVAVLAVTSRNDRRGSQIAMMVVGWKKNTAPKHAKEEMRVGFWKVVVVAFCSMFLLGKWRVKNSWSVSISRQFGWFACVSCWIWYEKVMIHVLNSCFQILCGMHLKDARVFCLWHYPPTSYIKWHIHGQYSTFSVPISSVSRFFTFLMVLYAWCMAKACKYVQMMNHACWCF